MTTPLTPLERPDGGFAMLALDQRESMRDLLVHGATDADLREFKETAAAVLAPVASAILLDRVYGVGSTPPAWTARTPLILAVDEFTQRPGQPVQRSVVDASITPGFVQTVGASAVKFLILWRRGGDREERATIVRQFVRLARDAGVASVLEGIVRPDGAAWESASARDAAIVDAADEFATFGADLYKAEVPGDPSDADSIEEGAARISAVVDTPWVVLSNGVPADAFPDAVAASCRGGASGFLAGRAVWTDSAAAEDRAASLAAEAVDRFTAIASRVPARASAV